MLLCYNLCLRVVGSVFPFVGVFVNVCININVCISDVCVMCVCCESRVVFECVRCVCLRSVETSVSGLGTSNHLAENTNPPSL